MIANCDINFWLKISAVIRAKLGNEAGPKETSSPSVLYTNVAKLVLFSHFADVFFYVTTSVFSALLFIVDWSCFAIEFNYETTNKRGNYRFITPLISLVYKNVSMHRICAIHFTPVRKFGGLWWPSDSLSPLLQKKTEVILVTLGFFFALRETWNLILNK